KILYGNWLTVPQGEAFISPRTLYLGSLLISPLHGLAWWTPAYFVGLIGCIWFAVRRPWPGSIMLVAVTAFTLYNASLPDWHGSGAFGMRRLTVITPILALGLATVLDSLRRRPAWQLAIAGALSGWGLQMTARYALFMIPHDVNVLGDLPLRALLFRPVSVPLGALLQSVSLSWIGRLVRAPRLDNIVILLACLCLVGLMLVAGRHRWATRVIRI
ncbi:MAG TPA: hypothetical protein VEZ12_19355, partial [Herpetosiphonaceae bacterium]|nr:hypothetical protein [Herpetosiphonaceae bacterium]